MENHIANLKRDKMYKGAETEVDWKFPVAGA